MSCCKHLSTLSPATAVVALFVGLVELEAQADEAGTKSRFEEHSVEFRNQDVTLAGSLLLPSSEVPVPAVVFVHGAGRQTRQSYRELGEYFASRGIAALIYDKRGCGRSQGAYESREPYENLVDDALGAVEFLARHRNVEKSQIGIWGLSQGAYIGAAAASRSADIRFVIVVGASVADGTLFFYRDNLFRRYGLSDTLRDLAQKAQLALETLPHNLRENSLLSSFARRTYPSPREYVHPVWRDVKQPVLAMWGLLDQNVPVGESVLGLKNSLAVGGNETWTMIIVPQTNHDLKISATGALHTESHGYPPGALQTMTDWARRAIDRPAEIGRMRQEGSAPEAGVLPRMASYERLRWYGNATIQAALWLSFLVSFGANTIAGVRRGLPRAFRRRPSAARRTTDKIWDFKHALCALNLLILFALGIVTWSALDQVYPSCPAVFRYLPALGTVSMLASAALLTILATVPRDLIATPARRVYLSVDVLCLCLFIPFLFYWNAVGLRY